jgi:hypothetical protein
MGYAVSKLEVVNELHMINCGECGTPFAMESKLYEKLRDTQGTFYCPNGHCRQFIAKSKAEILQEQLNEKDKKYWEERNLRLGAEGKLARLSKRIKNGVCPCCKRSFGNLHQHITKKHPEFAKKEPTAI